VNQRQLRVFQLSADGFLLRQVSHIKLGGLFVIFRKATNLLQLILAALPLLLVRALRPVILIRFDHLPTQSIGSLAFYPEAYLCQRDEDAGAPRTLDIFYHVEPVSNHQLKRMWNRKLHVSPLAGPIDRLNRRLPGGGAHLVCSRRSGGRDMNGLLFRNPPHLALTQQEERFGQDGLRDLGIPQGAPFVCFFARDSAYEDVKSQGQQTYHHRYRDSSIHRYLEAAEKLVERGYFAVRMGHIVNETLQTVHPGIIDYATDGRTDFMDIYLSAKCRMFLTGGAGIEQVSEIFRRPIAYVNWPNLNLITAGGRNNLFIPKTLRLIREDRILGFKELIDSGISGFTSSAQFDDQGIELVENIPNEIASLVVEMDERLKGTWATTREDEELQARFWSLFRPDQLHEDSRPRIGAELLRQHQALLN
jgi:putative glycosyltransferase (TIGR04372 family)